MLALAIGFPARSAHDHMERAPRPPVELDLGRRRLTLGSRRVRRLERDKDYETDEDRVKVWFDDEEDEPYLRINVYNYEEDD